MKCLNGFRFTTDIFVTLVINKKTKYEYTLFYQLQTPWTSKSNCFLEKDFLVLLMISLGEEIKNTETFHCDFSFPLKHWELNIKKKKLLIYFFLEHYITDQRSFHNFLAVQFYSVRCLSCVRLFQSHDPWHTRPPCLSSAPEVYPKLCLLSRWCHPTISSSVVPFSSCPQSLPASGSFPMSQLFAWGDQSNGVSTTTSVLPMHTQDLSPLG